MDHDQHLATISWLSAITQGDIVSYFGAYGTVLACTIEGPFCTLTVDTEGRIEMWRPPMAQTLVDVTDTAEGRMWILDVQDEPCFCGWD